MNFVLLNISTYLTFSRYIAPASLEKEFIIVELFIYNISAWNINKNPPTVLTWPFLKIEFFVKIFFEF